ncbi:MAG TPA: zinc-binding dehydrogenase [bacterium]|nr:zinc-binding dehydrogenase [bacterium]
MKAVMKTERGPGHVELREVPEPEPGAGQVRIEVVAAGICGTDIHIFREEFPSRPPVILGHEFSGRIDRVGPGAEGLAPGDPVVAATAAVRCGRCRYCLTGNVLMCERRLSIGHGVDGAFARYVVVPAEMVHPIPHGVDLRHAALTEPLAVAVHAVIERSRVAAGDTVLVSGVGPIGLLVLQVARAEGGRVIAAGTARDARRLELARRLGAEVTVDVDAVDLPEAVREWTRGAGVDAAFECAGAARSLDACLGALRRLGTLVQVGLMGRRIECDYEQVAMHELLVVGTYGSSLMSWPRALALLSQGRVEAAPLISDVLPLAAWEEGFRKTAAQESIKVLLDPQA